MSSLGKSTPWVNPLTVSLPLGPCCIWYFVFDAAARLCLAKLPNKAWFINWRQSPWFLWVIFKPGSPVSLVFKEMPPFSRLYRARNALTLFNSKGWKGEGLGGTWIWFLCRAFCLDLGIKPLLKTCITSCSRGEIWLVPLGLRPISDWGTIEFIDFS